MTTSSLEIRRLERWVSLWKELQVYCASIAASYLLDADLDDALRWARKSDRARKRFQDAAFRLLIARDSPPTIDWFGDDDDDTPPSPGCEGCTARDLRLSALKSRARERNEIALASFISSVRHHGRLAAQVEDLRLRLSASRQTNRRKRKAMARHHAKIRRTRCPSQ